MSIDMTALREKQKSGHPALWSTIFFIADELKKAESQRDELASAICWDTPTNRVGEYIEAIKWSLKQDRDRSIREAVRTKEGISQIEASLDIPEDDERGFDFGTIIRAIQEVRAQLAAKDAEIAKLSQEREAMRTSRMDECETLRAEIAKLRDEYLYLRELFLIVRPLLKNVGDILDQRIDAALKGHDRARKP